MGFSRLPFEPLKFQLQPRLLASIQSALTAQRASTMNKRICALPGCNVNISCRHLNARFCSQDCKLAAKRQSLVLSKAGRTCELDGCEIDISHKNSNARFCCPNHLASFNWLNIKRKRSLRVCAHCEIDISMRAKNARFCSGECRIASQNKLQSQKRAARRSERRRLCKGCGGAFSGTSLLSKFCSRSCRRQYNSKTYFARYPEKARAKWDRRYEKIKLSVDYARSIGIEVRAEDYRLAMNYVRSQNIQL